MIQKDAFQNLKGRRVYQFYLDEETGEITDITSRDDYVQVIRCKDCKHWKLLESSETIGTCWMFARYPRGDSFCDKAERKEE